MNETNRPAWIEALDEGDLQFLKRFLLNSGSLKAVAKEYGISYPTVRARLDRLIEKVRVADTVSTADPFERRLKLLVADGALDAGVARQLMDLHQESTSQRGGAYHEDVP